MNANDIATLALISFVLTLYIFFRISESKYLKKPVLLSAIVFSTILIVVLSLHLIAVTGTRFAMLGCIVLSGAMIFQFVFFYRVGRKRNIFLITCIISLLIGINFSFGIFGGQPVSERLSLTYGAVGNDDKVFKIYTGSEGLKKLRVCYRKNIILEKLMGVYFH